MIRNSLNSNHIIWLLLIVGSTGCSGDSSDKSGDADVDGSIAEDQIDSGTSGSCSGVTCLTPPENECEGDNTVSVYHPVGYCVDGECIYSSSDEQCETGKCKSGVCVDNPCQGVTCITPPASDCQDQNTLEVWDGKPGSCEDGVCIYNMEFVECINGCEEGTYKDEPCAGIVCDEPPPNYCVDSSLHVYTKPGVCDSGVCSYDYHVVVCDHDCVRGMCEDDPCQGVTCDTPRANYCDDDTAVTYDATGICVPQGSESHVCEYDQQRIACANGCINGAYCDGIVDCAGVCDGGAVEDCLGVCNGSAVVDNCGVCDGKNADCPEGLLAYWDFNEGGGTIVADKSGNGNTGTIDGGTWVEGIKDGALRFDCIDDWVGIQSDSSLNVYDVFSIEFLVNFNSLPAGKHDLLSKESFTDGAGFYVRQNESSVYLSVRNTNDELVQVVGTVSIGSWYHLVTIYDNGTMELYINGSLVDSATDVYGIRLNDSRGVELGSKMGTNFFIDAIFDYVRIYNRSLGPEDISAEWSKYSSL